MARLRLEELFLAVLMASFFIRLEVGFFFSAALGAALTTALKWSILFTTSHWKDWFKLRIGVAPMPDTLNSVNTVAVPDRNNDAQATKRIISLIRNNKLGPEKIRDIIEYVETLQRARAFVRLSEAIEAVSEKLTSAEYLELYNSAKYAREFLPKPIRLPPSVETDASA